MALSQSWNSTSYEGVYQSPLGYQFPYPPDWQIEATSSTVKAFPIGASMAPIVALTAQVREESLSELRARLQQQIQRDPANHILETQQLVMPRPATLIQVQTRLPEAQLRRFYAAELLDGGKLSLLFITSDQDHGMSHDYDYLLDVWRRAEVVGGSIPKYRRMARERWEFAFAFPEDWVIQHATDALVEIRSPVRGSNLPNIVMTFEEDASGMDLEQFAQRSLDFVVDELLDAQDIQQEAVQIGNCQGMAIAYKKLTQYQQIDQCLLLLPDPQRTCALTKITLSGSVARWDDYAEIFEPVKQSCYWLPSSENKA
jgi:hypothetical protein